MIIKENYKLHYSKKFFPNVHMLIFRIFFSKFSKFSKNLKNKKILDLGCGLSGNFSFFKYLKMKAYGVEISADITNLIKKRLKQKNNIRIGTNDNIPFVANFFDFIVCIHSIYYIDKDKTLDDNFKEVRRVMKKNGYLFFSLPKLNVKHIKFKKIEGHHYKVKNDLYNIRNGSKFGLFKQKKDLISFCSKYFKIIDVGYMDYELDNLSEFHWWVICKK